MSRRCCSGAQRLTNPSGPASATSTFDRSVPHGPARDAAREQRTILRQQAFAGVSRSLGSVGLTDPVDLVAATGVWEHMVSALMLFWRNHPEESAAAMVARAHRVLAAMAGHTLDRVRG